MGFIDGILSPIFKQSKLAIGQELARCSQRRVFSPKSPGLYGEFAMLLGEYGEQGVPVIVLSYSQDDRPYS
jgi:hypothetical protein